MTKNRRIITNNRIFFVTWTCKNRYSFFNEENDKKIVLETMNFYREKYKFKIYGYVIIPDHLHLIMYIPPSNNISKITQVVKQYISRKISNKNESVWQKGFYDHVIRDGIDFKIRLDYIHKNPLKHGLVKKLEEYKWSSYLNYYLNDDSIFKIDFVENLISLY